MLVGSADSPDIIVWKVDGNSLRLVLNVMNAGLSLVDEKTEAAVREYRKQYCKTVNTKGHIICW